MIDDDQAIQRHFGAKFSAAGHEMLYANNGNDGREIARRFQPDLILLDIRMPDTDGYKIAERLREERSTAGIPVVFLTNEDLTPEAEKAVKELFVAGYIHKSEDLNVILSKVEAVMSSRGNSKSP